MGNIDKLEYLAIKKEQNYFQKKIPKKQFLKEN